MKNWQKAIIGEHASIIDAMKIIDLASLQIGFVLDDKQTLLGTVTDGDIRRGILSGLSIDESVKSVMNAYPTVANENMAPYELLRILEQKQVRQLPIVNAQYELVDVFLAENALKIPQIDNEVVLMAGGLGTRLKPLTDAIPKPLLVVGTKPILETIIENFKSYGFHKFTLSVNYKSEMIKDYFKDGSKWGVQIRYIQEDKRLGTAGALSLLNEKPDKPIIVMNGDILTKINYRQLLDYHEEHRSIGTMCVRDYEYQIPYGVIKTQNHKLLSIEEKPVNRSFVNAGIYVLDPSALEYVPYNTFYDMPELFESLIDLELNASVFPIREYWLDIGRISDFEKANIEYREVFK